MYRKFWDVRDSRPATYTHGNSAMCPKPWERPATLWGSCNSSLMFEEVSCNISLSAFTLRTITAGKPFCDRGVSSPALLDTAILAPALSEEARSTGQAQIRAHYYTCHPTLTVTTNYYYECLSLTTRNYTLLPCMSSPQLQHTHNFYCVRHPLTTENS